MRRLILPEQYDGSGHVLLSGKEARRLIKVLRLMPGDMFPALDVQGRQYTCMIEKIEEGTVALRVEPEKSVAAVGTQQYIDIRRSKHGSKKADGAHSAATPGLEIGHDMQAQSRRSAPELILAVGILKGQKLDDVVRAGAELGFNTIQLLETERSVPRETSSGKLIRYERIVKEALGQSGSAVITKVCAPCSVQKFLEDYPIQETVCGLIFHEKQTGTDTVHSAVNESYQKYVLCVGPEGGFSDAELMQFMERGYVPAWLGPSILRADTAAIAVMAIIKLLLVERESWQAK
ncbi:MAG TPA: RsmE family RNA methyltransferase [Spirochaetia bacterium]|nr:RsmE family RNA methyltransferase [Spirochaetales bacterium]HRS64399.1 RsmE family RNA methyltransferase [Spirochaetia bacterium]HRV29400.1 RsmE family RNA methyltransferase [Spirochaetia bacterium]